ncbi:MAG TPA: hypothetical protein VGC41_21185, partial [Kofleriaceae bacterium]
MWKRVMWAVMLVACRKAPDWSHVALDDTITGRVMDARFEIRLPKGWKLDVDQASMKGWRPDVEDYTTAPSVEVGYVQEPPASLDAYIGSLEFVGTPVVDKKLVTAGDLLVVRHSTDNALVRVDYMTHKGATYLGCSAFQLTPGGVSN